MVRRFASALQWAPTEFKASDMSYHLYHHKKRDGRSLWLYSEQARDYSETEDMDAVEMASAPIMRLHPLRGEPVFYNPTRNTRTLNPPPDYNPLGPVAKGGFPGEIPFEDFEVAIFENRWPGLVDMIGGPADQAYGRCEVVVYATQDTGSLGDFPVARVALLLEALGHRIADISQNEKIAAIIPFENRGGFVGTSLPHPHGQIYALGEMPPIFARQVETTRDNNFFETMPTDITAEFLIEENEHASVFCPPFARYPFETWIMPKQKVTSPSEFSDDVRLAFAELWKRQIQRFDQMFDEPIPYIMWHAVPPKGSEDRWPYHIQFWPFQRGEGKMKYLAGVEQIAQLFLVDVMPEDAAQNFRDLVIA